MYDKNASLRYKISGGAPAGCYDAGGDTGCLVGTAGSPDGISNWSDVLPLGFQAPWRPDCHTNLFFDEPLHQCVSLRPLLGRGPALAHIMALPCCSHPPRWLVNEWLVNECLVNEWIVNEWQHRALVRSTPTWLADIMTTRSYEEPDGRLISVARTAGGGRTAFEKNGSWAALYHDEYPPTSSAESCFRLPEGDRGSAEYCAASCLKTPSCRYFWA